MATTLEKCSFKSCAYNKACCENAAYSNMYNCECPNKINIEFDPYAETMRCDQFMVDVNKTGYCESCQILKTGSIIVNVGVDYDEEINF